MNLKQELTELKEMLTPLYGATTASGSTVLEVLEKLEEKVNNGAKESNDVREGREDGNGDDTRGTKTAKVKRVSTPTY